jgi:DNA-binding response OmpR family regulator
LTAKDAIEDRVTGLDAGADDYLVKPFASMELLARLRSLARRRTEEMLEPKLEIDGLVMDLVRHEVRRDGKEIDLTAREFALLEYFLRHPGQAMTRTQILAAVWRYNTEVISNVVDIYVHYLREKIDRGFGKPLLRTIRGVGYSLRG